MVSGLKFIGLGESVRSKLLYYIPLIRFPHPN